MGLLCHCPGIVREPASQSMGQVGNYMKSKARRRMQKQMLGDVILSYIVSNTFSIATLKK